LLFLGLPVVKAGFVRIQTATYTMQIGLNPVYGTQYKRYRYSGTVLTVGDRLRQTVKWLTVNDLHNINDVYVTLEMEAISAIAAASGVFLAGLERDQSTEAAAS
jgi:hypothetical protein